MCEVPSWKLESRPLPLHPTNIYTCGVIIAPRVRGSNYNVTVPTNMRII